MSAKYSFLTVCLNPTLQRTFMLDDLRLNEVNRSSEYYFHASGKGVNTARVLAQLGGDVTHITHAGQSGGVEFVQLAEADGIKLVTVDSQSPVRTCYTLLGKRSHTTTEIIEEAEAVGRDTVELVLTQFDRLISKVDAVVISGSKAPGYPDSIFPDMVRAAKKEDVFVLCDFRGKDLRACLEYNPDSIKPNYSEFIHTFLNEEKVSEHADHSR